MVHQFLFLLFLLPASLFAQVKPVGAGVYAWPATEQKSAILISGSADVLSFLEVSANQLAAGDKKSLNVPADEEQLLLIKSGTLEVNLNGSTYSLVKGSIVLIMPSDQADLNTATGACSYHIMRYRSKFPVNRERGQVSGGSMIKDWTKIAFTPHDRGGVRSFFQRSTALTERFEMHVTTLNAGLNSHAAHTHGAEEIILVLEGNVEMLIGENSYKAKAGDLLFIPTNLLHGLKNDGTAPCSYYAYQWE